tara:strand:+ start:2239 stop:2376 length:138 start_codon:yes stop_codon:yes gene_type:complete
MLKRLIKVIITPILLVMIPFDIVCALTQFIITGEGRDPWIVLIWE